MFYGLYCDPFGLFNIADHIHDTYPTYIHDAYPTRIHDTCRTLIYDTYQINCHMICIEHESL